jgi:hypothetical protein
VPKGSRRAFLSVAREEEGILWLGRRRWHSCSVSREEEGALPFCVQKGKGDPPDLY